MRRCFSFTRKALIKATKEISVYINDFDALVQKETEEQLLAHIETLPEKYKEVIHLHYFENKSIQEIKAIISMSESTVRARLSYGLFLLKTQMVKKPKNPV